MPKKNSQFDAWNPGLESKIPTRLLPLVTLFRPENSKIDYAQAKAASEFCGLEPHNLMAFKVSRLVVHELLIRVTADLYVADGPNYEELGLNLRSMVGQILSKHINPKMQDLEHRFLQFRQDTEQKINAILERDVYDRAGRSEAKKTSGFLSWFGRKQPSQKDDTLPEILAQTEWQSEIRTNKNAFDQACYKSLRTVVGRLVGTRGRLVADKDLVCNLASNLVCNTYGSKKVGHWIEPIIAGAASAEGYRFLPYQKSPFFMNVKGASAAGKSTIRPLQRKLADKLGIPWKNFALISPDYWRKFLLEYDSLGDDFKYAAMLTGQELEIIDKKLDHYMSEKAALGKMPHLLIDRFRFDSFAPSPNKQAESTLISRFGDTVYLFFIITPPAETVERAWKRGKNTGRYKAVDDLLYHNIEAYTGMPQLFFSWVTTTRQKIHFEFLDNNVPLGGLPRTVAFGWNDEITILDWDCLRNINRYQDVNIDARRPEDVLLKGDKQDDDFLKACIEKISNVTFANHKTGEILGKTVNGKWAYQSDNFLEKSDLDHMARTEDELMTPLSNDIGTAAMVNVSVEKKYTVGTWDGLV